MLKLLEGSGAETERRVLGDGLALAVQLLLVYQIYEWEHTL